MRKGISLIAIIGFIGLGFLQVQHLRSQSEEEPASSTKKPVVIWKGEVTGIYKNRASIKVKIYRNQKISKLAKEELEALFAERKEYPVFQKETHIQLGTFVWNEILWEEVRPKNGKETIYEITLRGFYGRDPNLGKGMPDISVDCYIASVVSKDFYIEPGSFFKGRSTPKKNQVIHPTDKKEMVLVPRGLFLYGQGTDPSLDSFNPYFMQLKLSTIPELRAYYIDKYEVTNQEYARFLEKTNSPRPSHWKDGKYPEGEEDHPVHSLTYREVESYATWVGKRVPTEWEWEKAAKGSGVIAYTNRDETVSYEIQSQKYPFGDEFDPMLCNTKESKIGKTVSIYELPEEGASPYGAIGMCGNVSEWTSSTYETYPGHFLRSFSFGKQFRVVRGGSFADNAKQATVYARNYGGIPNLREDRRAGFRLVWDLSE